METNKTAAAEPTASEQKAPVVPTGHMPVFRVAAVIAMAGFVLTGMYRYLLLTAIALVLGFGGLLYDSRAAKKGKNLRKTSRARVLILLLCIVPVLAFPPLVVESSMRWQYPFQRFIINSYRNISEPNWFPEIDGDKIISDYHFSYLPSIMQGTGHYSIAFNTTEEQMTDYIDEYKAGGGLTKRELLLSDCLGGGNNTDFPALWLDETIRKNVSERTWVCVLDAVYDWNHPHTSAVILDAEHNRIQFLQLG